MIHEKYTVFTLPEYFSWHHYQTNLCYMILSILIIFFLNVISYFPFIPSSLDIL